MADFQDLLQNILFYNTEHSSFEADEYFATVQTMLERVLVAYPNLLQDDNSLSVASVISAVISLRNNTYTLFLLLHLIPDTPSLTQVCLNHCHDRAHTLEFISRLTHYKTREFDGPNGWKLFGERSPYTGRGNIEHQDDPLTLSRSETPGGCEFDSFVQTCRTLWLNTTTPKSQTGFQQQRKHPEELNARDA